jgi:S-adenosylmethionine:tRNA ribosyltransferase-isomerase
MDVSQFDFELPPELIAQEPSPERTAARLLYLERETGRIVHAHVSELPGFLKPGDLLVANNTRVFPARLLGRRHPSGGAVECLLIKPDPGGADGELWEALMHPGQKLKPGAQVVFEGAATIFGEILEQRFFGRRLIRLTTAGGSLQDAIDAIGHVPLPPYIKRADRETDRERYQTVFARHRGSVAAPTAGLHFTDALLRDLDSRGIERALITLHVGYGTFQPVRVGRVEEHRVEPERYEISDAAADAVNRAIADRRRVVAVGTTTTRALEGVAAANGGRIVPGPGTTDLFIYPGFHFQVLGGLMTNFHLPRSSLLMLVSAFAGRERLLDAYRLAVEQRYRFYSYGDAMLVL